MRFNLETNKYAIGRRSEGGRPVKGDGEEGRGSRERGSTTGPRKEGEREC